MHKRTTFKLSNWNRPAPKKLKNWMLAIQIIAMGAIPIIGNVRGLPENLTYNLVNVILPAIALIARGIEAVTAEDFYFDNTIDSPTATPKDDGVN